MTKKEFYANVMALVNGEEITATSEEMIAQAEHEIKLLEKKVASKSSKPSAKQVENAKLKEDILAKLEASEEALTIPSIMELTGALTSQKVSAMLIQLRKEGKVKRTYVKKVAHFELGSELEE